MGMFHINHVGVSPEDVQLRIVAVYYPHFKANRRQITGHNFLQIIFQRCVVIRVEILTFINIPSGHMQLNTSESQVKAPYFPGLHVQPAIKTPELHQTTIFHLIKFTGYPRHKTRPVRHRRCKLFPGELLSGHQVTLGGQA
ncbi:Uncharacterised protein [Salmonella enterica subsp. enterica serovar Typhi]|nr:Uncharacterised protein [Salmonella enterica subsp. enterica serovar Typhi]